jgi:hypothetical protein
MEVIKNIPEKVTAIQNAETAILSINEQLGKDFFGPETMAMLSELKVDLAEIKAAQAGLS